MQSIIVKDLKEMEEFAISFVENLPSKSETALVIGLVGDLGSGKTTFVQSVAKLLKVKELVVSPTFVLQKRYQINLEKSSFESLIHIDAYRLENGKDLLGLDWNEISNNSKNIIFIEWPERVEEVFDSNVKKIYYKFIDEHTREISYEES